VYCGGVLPRDEEMQHTCYTIREVKSELSKAEGRPRCPWCDSRDVASMIYGSPSPYLTRECAVRKLFWGGRLVDGSEPQWHCMSCDREWGRPREDKTSYCALCGQPSSSTWCSACNERAREDAVKIFEEAKRELLRRERSSMTRAVTFVVLIRHVWANEATGLGTRTLQLPLSRLLSLAA
jgi:hypothetical protein